MTEPVVRRLTAIMFTDLVGYSKLIALSLALTGCSMTLGGQFDKDNGPGFIGKATVETIRQQQWTEGEIVRRFGPPTDVIVSPHALEYVNCVWIDSREVPLFLPIPGVGAKTRDNWCEWVAVWFDPSGRASEVKRRVKGCGGCGVDVSQGLLEPQIHIDVEE
jgi:hypothetical protein